MREVQSRLAQVESERGELWSSVAQVRERNRSLKREYDSLLEQRGAKEIALRDARELGQEMVEDMIKNKQMAAMKMNNRNERRVKYADDRLKSKSHKEVCSFI